jgi:hypothetical protein
MPAPSVESIDNLMRIVGKTLELKDIKSNKSSGPETLVKVVSEARKKEHLKLRNLVEEFLKHNERIFNDHGISCEDLRKWFISVALDVSHKVKEFLLSSTQEKDFSKSPLLHHVLAILKKKHSAKSLLRYFKTEPVIERCIFLAALYQRYTQEKSPDRSPDRSFYMRQVCDFLILRLGWLSPESYYCEMVSMKSLRYEIFQEDAIKHFKECMQLLRSCGSHKDAQIVLKICRERLLFLSRVGKK